MKRKLYFVWPDVESARQAEKALLLQRLGSRRIRFLARPGLALDGLPAASIFQSSDWGHSLRLGVMSGALAGLFAALLLGLPPAILLGLVMGGALFGAWSASLIGISVPSRALKPFAADLAAGRVLMMVEVPETMAGEVAAWLGRPSTAVVRQGHYRPAFS